MRYPFLHPIDQAPGLSTTHRSHLRRISGTICKRTGLHACYNERNSTVLFHNGDQFGGPLALEAFRKDGCERRWSDSEVDHAVEYVKLGYIPREDKDRIASRNEWLESCNKRDAIQSHTENGKPEAKSVMGYADRKRRGVEKVISV